MNIKNKNKVILWTLFAILLMAGFSLRESRFVHAQGGAVPLPEINSDLVSKGLAPTSDLERNKSINLTAPGEDICEGIELFSPSTWAKCFLLYVLKFIGTAIQAATTLFMWVIDTDNMKAVINNSIIYEMWGFVRDMLNVAFILVLLFSAFCTVFQISKYSYKNLLLTLIIMALLVNFSFPIARAIIDFSNVIMYYLINGLGSGIKDGKFFTDISSNGGLNKIVNPSVAGSSVNMQSDASFLIAAVVFTFIFMVTLVIIAVLLLIRVVILAVLIIFASIAFVGSIVPFLSRYASEWWDTLFKYAFFGPVMIFMMVVATKMITSIAIYDNGKMAKFAVAQSGQEDIGRFIAALAFFSIPIVILWIGIGSAQKMSIAGAGAVVGRGQKFMKWVGGGVVGAGKWGATAPGRGLLWTAKQTGVPGGMKIKYDDWKKKGRFGSEAREGREAKFAGGKAEASLEAKKRKELRDKWKDAGGASDRDIDENLASKDRYKRQSAAMEAAENKGFRDLAQYQLAKLVVSSDPVLQKAFEDKVKEKHIRFLIEDDMQKAGISTGTPAAIDAYRTRLEKLSPDQMSKQIGLHENIDTNVDIQNYILADVAPDTEYHKEFFKKLTRQQRAKYVSVALNP